MSKIKKSTKKFAQKKAKGTVPFKRKPHFKKHGQKGAANGVAGGLSTGGATQLHDGIPRTTSMVCMIFTVPFSTYDYANGFRGYSVGHACVRIQLQLSPKDLARQQYVGVTGLIACMPG
jgi:hypothetical protein